MNICGALCYYLQMIFNFILSIPSYYIFFGIIIIFLGNYYFYKCSKLALHYNRNSLNEFILKNTPTLSKVYKPTIYLFLGLLQTLCCEITGKLAPINCGVVYEREIVKLKDGGQLSLDWPEMPKSFVFNDDTPIIVILSGMTGGRKDTYVASLSDKALKNKCRPVLMNERGLSKTLLTTPKLYCADMTEDVSTVLETIRKKYPNNRMYGVGFSLGANILTNVFFYNYIVYWKKKK